MSLNVSSGFIASEIQYLSDEERTTFFAIYLIILLVAVFGNLAAIFVTIKRNHRFLQKACLISLSISDIVTASIYAINNIETFSHPLVNWTLGPFMCSLVPMLQVLGITASTSSIVAIAIDRYRNVVHALTKRWNPRPFICILGIIIQWTICIGVSYPIFNMFTEKRTLIVYLNSTGSIINREFLFFCFSPVKEELMTYYICMTVLIFLSLFLIFIWLYFQIAKLVWKHRKPLGHRLEKSESSLTAETSTTQTTDKPRGQIKSILTNKKSIHVERKIRTFKIIVCLMSIFFVCRLPFWIYNIVALVGFFADSKDWVVKCIITAIALLNCAINPFLYSFLNQTITILVKIHRTATDFICKICCCCCSNTEFEEFERENPFIVENYEKKRVDTHPMNRTFRNSRVKFEDAAFLKRYSQETDTLPKICKEIKKY